MPLIARSDYPGPPWWMRGAHLETIVPNALRRVNGVRYERERLWLPDGDFVDLDWVDRGSKRLALLSHGLEGDSSRPYMKGMAKIFSQNGWDVLAWHCRSCSGEINLRPRMYHHGEIGDIGEVLRHALRTKRYRRVVLIGFSMGGNIALKFAGVHGRDLPEVVSHVVAFSAPCMLGPCAEIIDRRENTLYRRRFLRALTPKIQAKAAQFPGLVDPARLRDVKVWRDFDELFAAPLNGFPNAEAFYQSASSRNFFAGIRIPALLVNALNDPILAPECYPHDDCRRHPTLFLETPRRGGHVGFALPDSEFTWAEKRALEFVGT